MPCERYLTDQEGEQGTVCLKIVWVYIVRLDAVIGQLLELGCVDRSSSVFFFFMNHETVCVRCNLFGLCN